MCQEIENVVATCGRCGFATKAMAGCGVAAAYPDRRAWMKRCWQPSAARQPLACGELMKAVVAASRAAERRRSVPSS